MALWSCSDIPRFKQMELALERIKDVNHAATELLKDLKAIAASGMVQLDALPRPAAKTEVSGESENPPVSEAAKDTTPPSRSPTQEASTVTTPTASGVRVAAVPVMSSLRAPAAMYHITERSFHSFEAAVTKIINLSGEAVVQHAALMESLRGATRGTPPKDVHHGRHNPPLSDSGGDPALQSAATVKTNRSASVVKFAKKRAAGTVGGEIDETFSDGGSEEIAALETPPARVTSMRGRNAAPPLALLPGSRRDSIEAPFSGGALGLEVDGDIMRAYSPVASFRMAPTTGTGGGILTRTASAVSVFSMAGDDEPSPISPQPMGGGSAAFRLDGVRQLPISPPPARPSTSAEGEASPTARRFSNESSRPPAYATNDFVLSPQGRATPALVEASITETMLSDLALRFPALVPTRAKSKNSVPTLSLTAEVNAPQFSAIDLALELFDQATNNGGGGGGPVTAMHRAASAASLGSTSPHGSHATMRTALHSSSSTCLPQEPSTVIEPTTAPSTRQSDTDITVMKQLFVGVCLSCLLQYRFPIDLGFDLAKLVGFCNAVFWLHSSRDGFHGVLKTVDALHAAHTCLSQPHVSRYLGDVDIFATLLVAMCMDIAHPGVTNDFLVRSNHPIANLFGVTAPTENMATAVTFALLRDAELNFIPLAWWNAPPLAGLNGHTTNGIVFRDLVAQLIIATNPTQHLQVLRGLATIFSDGRKPTELTSQNLLDAARRGQPATGLARVSSFDSVAAADGGVTTGIEGNDRDWLAAVRQAEVPLVLQGIIRLCDHSYAIREVATFHVWVDAQIFESRRQHLAEVRAGLATTQLPRFEGNPFFYQQRVLQLVIAPLLDALPIVPHEWRRCFKANVTACVTADPSTVTSKLPTLQEPLETAAAWEDNTPVVLSALRDILPTARWIQMRPPVASTAQGSSDHPIASSGDPPAAQGSASKAADALSRTKNQSRIIDAAPDDDVLDIAAPHMIAVLRLLSSHIDLYVATARRVDGSWPEGMDTFGAELFAMVHRLQPRHLGKALHNALHSETRAPPPYPLQVSQYATAATAALQDSEASGVFGASALLMSSAANVHPVLVWVLKLWQQIRTYLKNRETVASSETSTAPTGETARVAPPIALTPQQQQRLTELIDARSISPYSIGRR